MLSLLKESGNIGTGLPPASPTESCTSDVSIDDNILIVFL